MGGVNLWNETQIKGRFYKLGRDDFVGYFAK